MAEASITSKGQITIPSPTEWYDGNACKEPFSRHACWCAEIET